MGEGLTGGGVLVVGRRGVCRAPLQDQVCHGEKVSSEFCCGKTPVAGSVRTGSAKLMSESPFFSGSLLSGMAVQVGRDCWARPARSL